MKYREFGNSGIMLSQLGMGCMRLPVLDGDQSKIDTEEVTRMFDYAIEKGLNYFDTAYGYHGGNSERFLGSYLQERGIRDKVYITTKLPPATAQKEGAENVLKNQLERLKTDYIDFYLFHNIQASSWKIIKDLDLLSFMAEQKRKGVIRHIGFSFHDTTELFKEVLDSFDWDMAQCQYNFMDVNYQVGTEGVEYAGKRGIPLFVMEPMKGGSLTNVPRAEMDQIFADCGMAEVGLPDVALRFVLNRPEVTVVLSGMSCLEHVKQNIATAETAEVGAFTQQQQMLVGKLNDFYNSRIKANCTLCNYCVSECPQGLDIPGVFNYYNRGSIYSMWDDVGPKYIRKWEKDGTHYEDKCIKCGACEVICSQGIKITEIFPQGCEALRNWKNQ
jgi:hypothetical protein